MLRMGKGCGKGVTAWKRERKRDGWQTPLLQARNPGVEKSSKVSNNKNRSPPQPTNQSRRTQQVGKREDKRLKLCEVRNLVLLPEV